MQAVALDEHRGAVPLSYAVVADDDARLLVADRHNRRVTLAAGDEHSAERRVDAVVLYADLDWQQFGDPRAVVAAARPAERGPAADHQQTAATALHSDGDRLLVRRTQVANRIVGQHDQSVFAEPPLGLAPGERLARMELRQTEPGAQGALDVAVAGRLPKE